MNLHHLELFYYVARHGGISRAVRNMPYGIQQPAVSSQILALEEDLGTKLFDRQPFRLTEDGERLYAFLRQFFDHVESVGASIRKDHAPALRIAASELILRDYLPSIIQRMKRKDAKVRFALRSGTQSTIEKWLLAGEIDVAVTSLDAPPSTDLTCLSVFKLPLVLLAPRASKVKTAEALWSQTPISEPLIRLPKEDGIARSFDRGLKRLKVDWPVSIEASSTELISQYVANGYGFGVSVDLPQLVKRTGVRPIPLPDFEPVEIAVLWRAPTTPLLEMMLDVMRQRAAELRGEA